MKILFLNIVLSLVCIAEVKAQQATNILTLADFIQQTKNNHPLAKIANIQVDKANANILMAKGAFDPTIQYEADRKTFNDKNYFYYNDASLKIPLPIGDIKTGIENNGGQFITTEVTKGQSSYAGIEIPLAKGLFIDSRRATLQQAKIALGYDNAQKQILINNLLLDAYEAYYQWAAAYELFTIFNNYAINSNNRLQLVKSQFINGDKPLMDTIEAYAQYQSFIIQKNDAFIKLKSAQYQINNFLWSPQQTPINLLENVVPDSLQLNLNINPNSTNNNPVIQQYFFKLDGLNVEKKLKFQSLLPTVNLKSNLLNNQYNVLKNVNNNFIQNNYKWAIDIKIPLRFREGRGAYKMAKLKITETQLALQQKQQEINNKIADYTNQIITYQTQWTATNSIINNYSQLLRNELLKFNNGESSLFLVNTRENKLLESIQKSIELKFKAQKANITLQWVAGTIN
ncbi:TolC family protein [Ferruginibacter yonginensis]|uniref:TolC family protein n=1 Tax=Ferruginibacter yonginensis TaxID=1310416 RepID=A0ABV8QVV2_9BACT